MEANSEQRKKLDLYSIPVFLFEVIILGALTYAAYYIHFQYKHEPYLSGFYCDDVSLRQGYSESTLTQQFTQPDNELTVLALLLAVPITVIIFCELVNSMFGSLKFRKINSLCKCCKLHSITRRTIRFAGAYAFGFLIVVISCNIIATLTGQLKPYFAQECPRAYRDCLTQSITSNTGGGNGGTSDSSTFVPPLPAPAADATTSGGANLPDTNVRPLSQPIISNSSAPTTIVAPTSARLVRSKRQVWPSSSSSTANGQKLLERQWIILSDVNLSSLCNFTGDPVQTRKFDHLSMSWPSFPAAIITYACLFIATYLCYVGTARPFRLLTSTLVVVLLLLALIFDVQLIKEHFSHWQDVAGGAGLALVVVVFVLIVYLNKFRDSHYYELQKLPRRYLNNDSHNNSGSNYNGYSNEIALEQFDKTDDQQVANGSVGNGDINGGGGGGSSVQNNNDLAMRYFQIPRANYRGAPRPLSNATNHM